MKPTWLPRKASPATGRDEGAEGHRPLRSDDAAEEGRPERGALAGLAGQVAGVVGDVRAEGQLPAGAERDREQERHEVEVDDADVVEHVVLEEQADRQVREPTMPTTVAILPTMWISL